MTKVPREERLELFIRTSDAPQSFWSNSKSEEKLLAFVKTCETLYHKFFPDRKPLLLYPENECQKEKMICTFVRPTLLPYDEPFDLRSCCSFIAGYMQYEPLYPVQSYFEDGNDTVEKLPSQLVSPSTALDWQIGNCFEMSIALTSLLIGCGYNAYTVVGSATKSTCLADQSEFFWEDHIPPEFNSDDEAEDNAPQNNEYLSLIPERPALRFTADPDPVYVVAAESPSSQHSVEEKQGSGVSGATVTNVVRPVHCWVAIFPGGRKSVTEVIFAEPSTGVLTPVPESGRYYVSIEAVFNDHHYFINMHPEAPVSSLSPNLKDGTQWESLFSLSTPQEEEVDSLTGTIGGTRRTLAELNASSAGTQGASDGADDAGLNPLYVPVSWSAEITLNRSQFESRYPSEVKEVTFANALVRYYAEYSQPDLRVQEVLVPDEDYPDLQVTHTFYRHRADYLRHRCAFLSVHAGQSLRSLQATPSANRGTCRKVMEWYDHGRMREAAVEGLRELIYEPGKQRTMKFYWKARSDGLCRRVELLYDASSLRKVKEFYKGRTDRLWYRSFSYSRPRTMRETNMHSLIISGPGVGSAVREYPRLDPIRISQKFTRNESLPAAKDVGKTVFLRPPAVEKGSNSAVGEMWVLFHYSEGSIIRPYHLFAKPSSSVEEYIASSASCKPVEPPVKVVTMPGEDPPSELDLYNERKWMNAVEVNCLLEHRTKMDECMDILKTIDHGSVEVWPILSSYDTLRNRPKETEAERAKKLAEALRREESRKDYLAPYIARLEMPVDFDGNYLNVRLTADQARQVRDEALQELKERLIQRGHIMQSRMDKEKEEFNKRQQIYRKNCDASGINADKDTEEFALYCKEATWRMKVLDDRLSKHVEHASEKYTHLAQRLAEDPRLSALYRPAH